MITIGDNCEDLLVHDEWGKRSDIFASSDWLIVYYVVVQCTGAIHSFAIYQHTFIARG